MSSSPILKTSLLFLDTTSVTVPFRKMTTPVRVQADGNNFAPRAGIAYSSQFWKGIFGDNKTVIRAGFGMFYDSLYTNILDNAVASSPNAIKLRQMQAALELLHVDCRTPVEL